MIALLDRQQTVCMSILAGSATFRSVAAENPTSRSLPRSPSRNGRWTLASRGSPRARMRSRISGGIRGSSRICQC